MKHLQAGSPADLLSGYMLLAAGPLALGTSLSMAAGPLLALAWTALAWFAWTSNRLTGVGLLSVIGYLGCALTQQSPELTLLLTGGTLLTLGMSSAFEVIFELYGNATESPRH